MVEVDEPLGHPQQFVLCGAVNKAAAPVQEPREQVAVLHALRVLPACGGRGCSRRLMEHAIRTARAWGQKALRLDCARGNDVPARLYRSCGFREVGTAVITYEDIGEPMEFRLFELAL